MIFRKVAASLEVKMLEGAFEPMRAKRHMAERVSSNESLVDTHVDKDLFT